MVRDSRDFDPWKDTVAGPGPEVDTSLDNGYDPSSLFGASPETVGVPRRVRGIRRPRTHVRHAATLLLVSVVGVALADVLLGS